MKKNIKIGWSISIILVTFITGYLYAWSKFAPPHFHANFALYIDGERMDFSGDEFMEDVAGCGLSDTQFPKDRAHLHENNPDTIHIHAAWVSWGHFFANNDILFNDSFISLPNGDILQEDETRKLSFLLNWEITSNVYNELIKSEDRLLISYWGAQDITELFISDNAGDFNHRYDPGSCSGNNSWNIFTKIIWAFHMGH